MSSVPPIDNDQSFSQDANTAPDRVYSAKLDDQVSDVKNKINEIIAVLALVLRDDDQLADSFVRLFSLHPEITSLLGSAAGWQPKVAARVASTANLALTGLVAVDGITLSDDDRVLAKDQTLPAQNGLWVAKGGAWVRATDADTGTELGYACVPIAEGVTNARTSWICTSAPGVITIDVTAVAFTNLFGGGVNGVATGGTGVTSIAAWPTAIRLPVTRVSTADETISAPGLLIDGYGGLTIGDRLLLTGQVPSSENGLWQWNGDVVPMTRTADYPAASTLAAYAHVMVLCMGGSHAGSIWQLATTGAISIDVTAVNWTKVQTGMHSTTYAAQVASDVNISIAAAPASIDALVMTTGQRALLFNQTVATQNGLWVFNGAGVAMTRPLDWSVSLGRIALGRMLIPVLSGTYAGRLFGSLLQNTIADVDAGSTSLVCLPPATTAWSAYAVAMATNVTITAPGAALDGVTLADGDGVLLTGQTLPAQNGPWIWRGAAVSMVRHPDFHQNAAGASFSVRVTGAAPYVIGGTYAGQTFRCTTTGMSLPGTTALAFTALAPLVSASADVTVAGRNLVMNGHMLISQRLPLGVAGGSAPDGVVTLDRWVWRRSLTTGAMPTTQIADSPTATAAGISTKTALKITVTSAQAGIAAADFAYIQHTIEVSAVTGEFKYFGKVMTLSFWVKSAKTGIHCVAIGNGSDRSYIAEYTISVASTWEKKTITFTMHDGLAGTWTGGVKLRFIMACGSNNQAAAGAWTNADRLATVNQVNEVDSLANDFRLTQVDLRAGATSGPGEFLSFPDELLRCQRYFWKTFNYTRQPAQGTGDSNGALVYRAVVAGVNGNGMMVQHPVRMYAIPAPTYYNPISANALWRNLTDPADSGAASTGPFATASERSQMIINPQVAGDGIGEYIAVHASFEAEIP